MKPTTSAERALLDELSQGGLTRLGSGGLPGADETERVVRAEMLRHVLTAPECVGSMHQKGLRVAGALIRGPLDLEGCRIDRDVWLVDCRFDGPLTLRSCDLRSLQLDGSVLPGVSADKLVTAGGVYLRGTTVDGSVELAGARIGGALVADGATLRSPSGPALAADGIDAPGGLLLRGATVDGVVSFEGARVGADLDLTGARLENVGGDVLRAESVFVRGDVLLRQGTMLGRCLLTGARVGGDVDLGGGRFSAPGAEAVLLNRAAVDGALMIRDGARLEGLLNLNGTRVDALVDAVESWPGPGDLALNRFIYAGLLTAPSDAALRLDWLSRQDPARWGEDFWPQPYEQLAAVLAASGHGDDAQRVLVERERLQRRARRARAKPWLWRVVLRLSDAILQVTIGYGNRPLRAFGWLGLLWIVGAAAFAAADVEGAMRPAPFVVQRAPEWVLCGISAEATAELASLGLARRGLAAPGETQTECWRRQPEAQAFIAFNAWMFALDTLVPAVQTGQTEAWAPDQRVPFGMAVKTLAYALTILGWALGLLAVAGFSGIVRSR